MLWNRASALYVLCDLEGQNNQYFQSVQLLQNTKRRVYYCLLFTFVVDRFLHCGFFLNIILGQRYMDGIILALCVLVKQKFLLLLLFIHGHMDGMPLLLLWKRSFLTKKVKFSKLLSVWNFWHLVIGLFLLRVGCTIAFACYMIMMFILWCHVNDNEVPTFISLF